MQAGHNAGTGIYAHTITANNGRALALQAQGGEVMDVDWILLVLLSLLWLAAGGIPWKALARHRNKHPEAHNARNDS